MFYARGRGVNKDSNEAVKWCRKAAEQGHLDAQFQLGLLYNQKNESIYDGKEAERWLRKAAEQGLPDAQLFLGYYYIEFKDFAEAERWLRKAADQGNPSVKEHARQMLRELEKTLRELETSSRNRPYR
jgi:FimV-like protein